MHPEIYLDFLFHYYPELDASIVFNVEQIIEGTNWSNPQTASDWNNSAVLDLIAIEYSVDINNRQTLLEQAQTKLENGFALDNNLFCCGHYILLSILHGEYRTAINLVDRLSLDFAIGIIHQELEANKYLIYLPPTYGADHILAEFFNSNKFDDQVRLFLSEVIRRSPMVFYNYSGTRLLDLSLQFSGQNFLSLLMLGINKIMSGMNEGIMWLKNALNMFPDESKLWQAVYLGYLTMGDTDRANFWLEQAKNQSMKLQQEWFWTNIDKPEFTYIPFEQNLIFTAEPSFRSIVTSVLLAQGDWFEREMEFWRESIQPGMTVIDVGANAGVYTFSAAMQVGETGLVLAIEPFSKCVQYLQETCKLNQIDWVKVCAGAASDSIGSLKLSIHLYNEINEILSHDTKTDSSNYELVECFTLDSLIDIHQLKRVDFLKIDVEGHELQVLKGSQKLLRDFRPIIIYENIARSQGSNLPVAEYLQQVGYKLFLYQPFVKALVPVTINADFARSLNVIALPPD